MYSTTILLLILLTIKYVRILLFCLKSLILLLTDTMLWYSIFHLVTFFVCLVQQDMVLAILAIDLLK